MRRPKLNVTGNSSTANKCKSRQSNMQIGNKSTPFEVLSALDKDTSVNNLFSE